jgi:hypothetical protein
VLGTSSTTAYLESAAGVQAGGRTGLTALTVAVLFLACLFIAPLAGVVPAYATAPALLFVACLMLRDLGDIEWNDTTEAMPAAITALVIPFTYSIAEGIAFGFITYAALKLTTGRAREVAPVVWVIAVQIRLPYWLTAWLTAWQTADCSRGAAKVGISRIASTPMTLCSRMRHSVSGSSSSAASRSCTSTPCAVAVVRRLRNSIPSRRTIASTASSVAIGSSGSMQKR